MNTGDIANAYFHEGKLSRTLLMRQPRGGVPEPEWDPTDLMLVVVPIYGQRDPGRSFWKLFRNIIIDSGMEEHIFRPALYFVSKKDADGIWDVLMTMVTHVDDLSWSDTPESRDIIKYMTGKFPIEKEATGDSGHDITQGSDFTVRLKCRDTTF